MASDRAKKIKLLLFDVDGVLIEDGGYYAALIKTLDYFNRLLGADPIVFGLPDRDQFQSRGYVNEWDLCPLCAGILLIETLARHRAVKLAAMPATPEESPSTGSLP